MEIPTINIQVQTYCLLFWGCAPWSVALWVYKNGMLKEIFVLKEIKDDEIGENCIVRNFIIYSLHDILLA